MKLCSPCSHCFDGTKEQPLTPKVSGGLLPEGPLMEALDVMAGGGNVKTTVIL